MQKIYTRIGMLIAITLMAPSISFAASNNAEKTYSGTVTRINDAQIIFTIGNGAIYTAQTTLAHLVRKNGTSMQFGEIVIGDKVEVKGLLSSMNIIAASYIRNMSLYAHKGTFSGKITLINPDRSGFTMTSKPRGIQNIRTDNLTSFKRNGSSATLAGMEPGMSVTVKGVWERTNTTIFATDVVGILRLINIDITGQLVMKSPTALTVVGANNAIYGIDISTAVLQSSNGKPITVGDLTMSGTVKISGKHVSDSVSIVATKVKDMSVKR